MRVETRPSVERGSLSLNYLSRGFFPCPFKVAQRSSGGRKDVHNSGHTGSPEDDVVEGGDRKRKKNPAGRSHEQREEKKVVWKILPVG